MATLSRLFLTALHVPLLLVRSCPDGYTFCSNEYETCHFSGTTMIAYGKQSTFTYQQATDSVACSNKVFGDPLRNVVKECCTMDASIVDAVNITNYMIGDVRMTWFDAEAYCQLQGTNLASVHSTLDREKAKALCMTRPATNDGCWLGLHQPFGAGNEQWAWSDGSDLDFGFDSNDGAMPTLGVDPWAPGEPNDYGDGEDCVQLRYSFAFNWNDAQCNDANFRYYPICNGMRTLHS